MALDLGVVVEGQWVSRTTQRDAYRCIEPSAGHAHTIS